MQMEEDNVASIMLKQQKLGLADQTLDKVRRAGDLLVAAFFKSPKEKEREALRVSLRDLFLNASRGNLSDLQRETEVLDELHLGKLRLKPFHWQIEFPEVFARENPGFDVFVGNPPFLGGKRISTIHGDCYRDWLSTVHEDSSSNADLVAHFFRRAFSFLREDATLGFIATNTISQGDTRASGLRWICTHSGKIYEARRRLKWPGQAAVVVSVIHVSKGQSTTECRLDGREVAFISAFLFHAGGHDDPIRLRANRDTSFIGNYVLGMGFTFDDSNEDASTLEEMRALLKKDSRNQQRIFPYIGGEELNGSPRLEPYRYVINFGDLSEEDSRSWPDLMAIIEAKVKPFRLKAKRDHLREKWWQFAEKQPALQNALRGKKRVLTNCQVSPHIAFRFLPTGWVYAHTLDIFIFEENAAFAVLQSRVHEIWARFFGSSMIILRRTVTKRSRFPLLGQPCHS